MRLQAKFVDQQSGWELAAGETQAPPPQGMLGFLQTGVLLLSHVGCGLVGYLGLWKLIRDMGLFDKKESVCF